MKKIILLSLIICLPVVIVKGQDKPGQEDLATVYFYRPHAYMASAIRMKIEANGQPVVLLKNRQYFEYKTAPGDYLFSSAIGREARLQLKLEAGKSYYVRCGINQGALSGIPVMEMVSPEAGQAFILAGMLKKAEQKMVSDKERKNRIGISMGFGLGFENEALFYDENNDDVTLSPGGGLYFGLVYGNRLLKNFDISAEVFYQTSMLSPALDNASANFNRLGMAVTPALVVPIGQTGNYNINIGAGPSLYLLGSMKVDATELEGPLMEMKYKPAAGFHGSMLFYARTGVAGSYYMGIRIYSVNYEIDPSDSSHATTDEFFTDPAGPGLDISFGYLYNF